MASNIALSVIIPYLKANQETIHQSLNSLFAQSLKNIEFIFVDDCCTDESRAIIEQYALQDERISILYNEKNSGPGFSRNEGINHAQGEYLAFFDLDDIVDENFYEKLYEKAALTHADIIKGSIVYVDEKLKYPKTNSKIQNKIQKYGLRAGLLLSFYYEHFTAIYKRDFIIKNSIHYGSTYRAQDMTFLFQVTFYANSIEFVNDVYYRYIITAGSLSNTKNSTYYIHNILAVLEQINFFHSKHAELAPELYNELLFKRFRHALQYFQKSDSPEIQELNEKIFNLFYETIMKLNFSDSLKRHIIFKLPAYTYFFQNNYKKFYKQLFSSTPLNACLIKLGIVLHLDNFKQ